MQFMQTKEDWYLPEHAPQLISTDKKNIVVSNISDLHADTEINKKWVVSKCSPKHSDFSTSTSSSSNDDTYNILIIPGDIGSNLTRIEFIFNHLVSQYDLVCYIIGNHEAWCSGKDPSYNSIHKLRDVYRCAVACGVMISPVKIISTHGTNIGVRKQQPVVIIPLSSWYHSGFDQELELVSPPVQIKTDIGTGDDANDDHQRFLDGWSDFHLCNWPDSIITKDTFVNIQHNVGTAPSGYSVSEGDEGQQQQMSNTDERALAFYFSKYNYNLLLKCGKKRNANSVVHHSSNIPISTSNPITVPSTAAFNINHEVDYIITFSHFIPRNECTPEKRFLYNSNLTKVIGSDYLESQIRDIGSHMHLFGHSHIPIDIILDGVRYIQWPLGYSREFKQQCSRIYQQGPLVVYNSTYRLDNNPDSCIEFELESEQCHWSLHYKHHKRDPSNLELASWVVEKKQQDLEKLRKIFANTQLNNS